MLLLLCWIPFNYTGYPMTWRTALVFLWGGLRGAVGMVMALFVFLDEEIHNSKFRSYCIFYMGTMAFFTVLINGGTVKWLLKYVGASGTRNLGLEPVCNTRNMPLSDECMLSRWHGLCHIIC